MTRPVVWPVEPAPEGGFRSWEEAWRGGVAAIGNFDGVHRGHLALLRAARAAAASAPLIALTFEPHPRQLFQSDAPPFRLTSPEQKARALIAAGADRVAVLPFTPQLAAMPAASFAAEVLHGALGLAHVVAGADFHFGHRRGGGMALLTELGAQLGFGVTALALVEADGGLAISATRIREHLRAGAVEAAAALLGRPFAFEGVVEGGARRGRTLGFPTANMSLGAYVRPAFGVYACAVRLPDGRVLPGAANLGIRPMWRTAEPLLETFILDFAGDLYGQKLEVALLQRLRGEAAFAGVEALVAQMNLDVAAARARFEVWMAGGAGSA